MTRWATTATDPRHEVRGHHRAKRRHCGRGPHPPALAPRESSPVSPVLKRTRTVALVVGGGVLAAALWWRKHPSACPYGQRFWLEPPHPLITRRRLHDVLAPQRGERVLEVGPGTGYYTLAVAERLAPEGRLDIFDVQQEMLEHTMRSARERGIDNITATQGDARRLPYADASFDAAYLTAVLGEIPDQDAALRELARVLKPHGRLAGGELFGDPHWVSPKRLRERAYAAGLALTRRSGTPLGYFALFHRDPAS
jgi:SAM-dependent methyltransferase